MITKEDLIVEGKEYLKSLPDEELQTAGSLSETLELLGVVTPDDVTIDDWSYIRTRGCYHSATRDRSISPILYKMKSSEILEITRYPFRVTAKDFTSDDSYEEDASNTELIMPDTEFYLNSREMVALISQIEYSGVCKAFGDKAYLNVRLVYGNNKPLWVLNSLKTPEDVDCIYNNPSNKAEGIKEQYQGMFPQLVDRIDKIAKKQTIAMSTIDTDAADLAAYYRSL
jgi:hypothetical protein